MREVTLEEMADNVNNLTFGDDRLGVMFYTKTVEDRVRTQKEGRKCFMSKEYIKIMVPGDRLNTVDRPIQRTGILPTDDILRFPKQYARYQNQQEQVAHDGTPLTLWPQMPAPLAEELKYINIFTVEQLADLADTYVGKVPMGASWKKKAQDFVAATKDQAQVNKLQSELSMRDVKIEALEKAVADQAARIEALLAKLEE